MRFSIPLVVWLTVSSVLCTSSRPALALHQVRMAKLGHHGHHNHTGAAVVPVTPSKGLRRLSVEEARSPGSVDPRVESWLEDKQHKSLVSPPHQISAVV
jgi:hypothetical protein